MTAAAPARSLPGRASLRPSEGSLPPPAAARPAELRRLPPASVLAVIGDPCVRDFLMEVALEEGYGVYCAEGALEALSVLGRERPGAILVDLDMPSAAGTRFLDIFRRLRKHEDVTCVAVTVSTTAVLPPGIVVVDKTALEELSEILRAHFAPLGEGARR